MFSKFIRNYFAENSCNVCMFKILLLLLNVWGILEIKHCYRIGILDCYTDPLGWKDLLVESGNNGSLSNEASAVANLCRNVMDMDMLFSSIIELGKGIG